MSNYQITLTEPAPDADGAVKLAKLLQDVAQKVAFDDMIKLLSAASKKPSVVKTALKFM